MMKLLEKLLPHRAYLWINGLPNLYTQYFKEMAVNNIALGLTIIVIMTVLFNLAS